MRVPSLVLIGLMALSAAPRGEQAPSSSGAPETFSANAQVASGAGAIAATIQIQINRYSPDFDRKSVEGALKGGGYPGFLTALRKAPEVGTVAIGDQKFAIRYAREEKTAKGRTITVVTDKPMFFVGGGKADAKPRAGYEVGAIQMTVDSGLPLSSQVERYSKSPLTSQWRSRLGESGPGAGAPTVCPGST